MSNITFLFGRMDLLFKSFLVLIILDYISGVLKAIYNKKINSKIGAKGIVKKIGYLLIIIVSQIIDLLYNSNMSIRDILLYMFITNEILSIFENISYLGIDIPINIKKIIGNGSDKYKSNK